jgi:cytochrome c-type biogenesis protein CcmF
VFNKLFGPEGVLFTLYDRNKVLNEPIAHYNAIQVPFTIIITLLMGAGQFLAYRKTTTASFFKRQILSLVATTVITFAGSAALQMWNPMYIFLFWTSCYAIIANAEFWLRWAKGQSAVAGSSVAHIGFGLIIAGSLISNANKTIISQNDTFIHEDFPSNENLLIEQGDTVPMGNYFVSWSEQSEEGHFVNYHLDFFEEKDGKLQPVFDLKPRIQINERMGNVAEPSTKHFALKDIYTHVTYADLRTAEELGDEEWKNQFEIEFNLNESHYLYGKYQVTLDTLLVDAPDKDGELEYAVLGAGITVKTMDDSTYKVMPVYVVEGNEVKHMDTEIKELGLKFRFDRINYETNRPVIVASEHKEEEVPFILVKAVVFPWINLLWIGSILMALGTVIAVVQRLKRA